MESFFHRYRNILVLFALLAAQLIGLAMQVRRSNSGQSSFDASDSGGVRLIRLWANAIISPPERLIHASKIGLINLWTGYLDLHNVSQQNKDLQKTIDRLRLEQAALLEDARQGQRLQNMLGFQEKYIYSTVAAQVYGSSGSDRSHIFYIDKGAGDGLKPDMAVISADGIVGKVRDVFAHSAQVLAVNDSTSGAGVILESTRIRGILRGDAAGRLQVVDVMSDQRIQPGEHVLTAGGDMVFPRGLPVGVVEKVARDPDRDGFIMIYIKPAAHLDRLDEVLVITSTEARFSPQEQQDIDTSEADKGAEAATMNGQKKASDTAGSNLPSLIDPNLPAEQQPLHDSTPPNFVPHPPQPLHADRFSPGTSAAPEPDTKSATTPRTKAKGQSAAPAVDGKEGYDRPDTKPAAKPATQAPRRNP